MRAAWDGSILGVSWAEAILDLKRETDQTFYVAMPLQALRAMGAARDVTDKLLPSPKAYPGRWDEQWAGTFDRDVRQGVSAQELIAIREAHNRFPPALAIDVGVDPQQMSQ